MCECVLSESEHERLRESCTHTHTHTHTKHLSYLLWLWAEPENVLKLCKQTPWWEEQRKHPAVYHTNSSEAGVRGESKLSRFSLGKVILLSVMQKINWNYSVKITFFKASVHFTCRHVGVVYLQTIRDNLSSWMLHLFESAASLSAFIVAVKGVSWEYLTLLTFITLAF